MNKGTPEFPLLPFDVTTMLCSLCEALTFDELHYEWNPAGYAHHGNFAELAACSNSTSCRFCAALHDTIKDGPQLGLWSATNTSDLDNEIWRLLPLFLRLVPTSDAIGTEDGLSSLLVFVQAPPETGAREVYLAMFGLYVDRTESEWKTGER